MIYINEIIVLAIVYLILALSSMILIEYAGLVSFLPAVLFGLAAAAYPLLFQLLPSHLMIMPMVLAGTILFGLIIGLGSYTYNRSFLAVLTFGLAVSYTTVSLSPLSGFPLLIMLTASLGVVLVLFFITWHLMNTPFADNLAMLKENELSVQLAGKSTSALKLAGITFSSFLAGTSAIIFTTAHTSTMELHAFTLSMLLLAVIVFTGQNILGILLGMLAVAALPGLLDLTAWSGGTITGLKEMIFAAIIILFLFLHPQGLFTRKHLAIKKPLVRPKIKQIRETPRQKAKRTAKEKKQKEKAKILKKTSSRLSERNKVKDEQRREKLGIRLKKRLLRERKKQEKELKKRQSPEELDRVEDKIKKMEYKKELARERLLRGETLVEKGARFFSAQGEKIREYIKKKK